MDLVGEVVEEQPELVADLFRVADRDVEHAPLRGVRDAPQVAVKDIADAIEFTYENWHKLKAAAIVNAQKIRLEWSWERQTETFIRWLEGETQ